MEFEERNKKPVESNSNLPMAVLITLVAIVCLLLYIGWQMISDTPSTREDIVATTDQEKSIKGEIPEEVNTGGDEAVEEDMPEIQIPKAETESVKNEVVKKEESTKTEPNKVAKRQSIGLQDGEENITHTVAAGETFFSIAGRYGLSPSALKNANPGISAENLKKGVTKLKVPVQTIHTVGPGDILRVVAEKYNISVESLMKANNKKKNYAERGEKLIIPLK